MVQVRIDVYYMRIDVYYHPSMDIYPSVYTEGDRTGDTCVCKNSLTMEIFHVTCRCIVVRDWSLITRRGGGGYKIGKLRVGNFLRPPPSRQGKHFLRPPPLLKDGNFLRPPITMAKTSSSHVKTNSKLIVSPLQHG